MEVGDTVGLDMRVPEKSGYRIVGASFDPALLTMVHYLPYDDDGQARAQYVFKALAGGATDVLVKMEPEGGGPVEIFKRVTVTVVND